MSLLPQSYFLKKKSLVGLNGPQDVQGSIQNFAGSIRVLDVGSHRVSAPYQAARPHSTAKSVQKYGINILDGLSPKDCLIVRVSTRGKKFDAKPVFLRQARKFLFFSLLPMEGTEQASSYFRQRSPGLRSDRGAREAQIRSLIQADLSLIV